MCTTGEKKNITPAKEPFDNGVFQTVQFRSRLLDKLHRAAFYGLINFVKSHVRRRGI